MSRAVTALTEGQMRELYNDTALVTVNNQFPGLKLVWAEYLGFWDFKNINFIKIVLGLCQENGIKDS